MKEKSCKANQMSYRSIMNTFKKKMGGSFDHSPWGGYTKDLININHPDPELFLQIGLGLGMEKQGEAVWPLRGPSENSLYYYLWYGEEGERTGVVLHIAAEQGDIFIGAGE